jgi:hypothetical protein
MGMFGNVFGVTIAGPPRPIHRMNLQMSRPAE